MSFKINLWVLILEPALNTDVILLRLIARRRLGEQVHWSILTTIRSHRTQEHSCRNSCRSRSQEQEKPWLDGHQRLPRRHLLWRFRWFLHSEGATKTGLGGHSPATIEILSKLSWFKKVNKSSAPPSLTSEEVHEQWWFLRRDTFSRGFRDFSVL